MTSLVFLGSNHNLRQMADIAELNGLEIAGVLDRDYFGSTDYICGVPVIGCEDTWDFDKDYVYFNAVNYNPTSVEVFDRNNQKRINFNIIIDEYHLPCVNLVHPAATIAKTVMLGQGVMIGAGAIISNDVIIQDHCQVREQSYIAHKTKLEQHVVLQVQGYIGSNIIVGEFSYIGIKGTLIERSGTGASAPSYTFVKSCERLII